VSAAAPPRTVRVVLPASLRTMTGLTCGRELEIELASRPADTGGQGGAGASAGAVTMSEVLDALESLHPTLRGTLRDRTTGQRRPFIRFFTCEQDLSHQPLETPLPEAVASGEEPVVIVAAIAGG